MRDFLKGIRLCPGGCFLLALLLRVLPLPWLGAAAGAAAVHELAHLAALALWGVFPRRLQLGPCGAVIFPPFLPPGAAACCILAGPLGSLLLGLTWKLAPRLSLCGIIQGCVNLLPLPASDGGSLLALFCDFCLPVRLRRPVRRWTQRICILSVIASAFAAGLFFRSLFPLTIIPVLLIFKQQIVKNPCKYRS